MAISRAIEHHSLHEPLWTAGDLAARLQVPRSTIYELTRRGVLPCVRLGRHIRFSRAEVERRLDQLAGL